MEKEIPENLDSEETDEIRIGILSDELRFLDNCRRFAEEINDGH